MNNILNALTLENCLNIYEKTGTEILISNGLIVGFIVASAEVRHN